MARSKQFRFRMTGLLATLALAWVALALDRAMFWALVGASAWALLILVGGEE